MQSHVMASGKTFEEFWDPCSGGGGAVGGRTLDGARRSSSVAAAAVGGSHAGQTTCGGRRDGKPGSGTMYMDYSQIESSEKTAAA